jgi:hypothetical protein
MYAVLATHSLGHVRRSEERGRRAGAAKLQPRDALQGKKTRKGTVIKREEEGQVGGDKEEVATNGGREEVTAQYQQRAAVDRDRQEGQG